MTRGQVGHLKKAFLTAFAVHANISAACRVAGIHRNTVYGWQERDEAFALAFKQAEAEALEVLEGEAFRRAYEGVKSHKPVLWQGEVVGVEEKVEYSDTLLIFLLKARAPEKYKDRHDITSGGLPIAAAHAALDAEIEQRLAALVAGGEGAAPVAGGESAEPEDAGR